MLGLVLVVTGLFFVSGARAQSSDVVTPPENLDEFDLGDEWVDESYEGGWFSPGGPLFVPDSGGLRLDLSGGIGFAEKREEGQDAALSASPAVGPRGGRQEYYAMATLQVPLERFSGGGSRYLAARQLESGRPLILAQYDGESQRVSPSEKKKSPAPAEGTAEAAPPSSSAPEKSPSGDASAEGAPREASSDDEHAVEAFGEYDLERLFTPALTLLVAREVSERVTAALGGAEGRIRSLIRRSRLSGLSPELRLRGVLGFDRTTSTEESVGIYPGDTTVRGGQDSLAEARLTFRLDRLVFGDGEPSLERQRIDLSAERRKLAGQALKLLFDWRLASSQANDVSLPPEKRVEASIESEAALAELHLLTGGWFRGVPTLRSLLRELPNSGSRRDQEAPSR